MTSYDPSNANWRWTWLVTIIVACLGALGRLVLLVMAEAGPSGVVEGIEQAWLGAVWLSVVGGVGLLLAVGFTHTLFCGMIWSLTFSLWDVLIEWPLSAVLGVVVPYSIPALILPMLCIGLTCFKPRLSTRVALSVDGWQSKLGATAVILLVLWVVGLGSRQSALSVIRSMGATSVRTERVSGLFSFGITWRVVWVEFGAAGHGSLEYRKLVTQLRKITSSDYRLTFRRSVAPTMSRQAFMKRLSWCGAHVNITS